MKKTFAVLLALIIIVSMTFVSCKGDENNKDTEPESGALGNQAQGDSGDKNTDSGSGDKESSGGLVVGEDDDSGKWGEFIPYN